MPSGVALTTSLRSVYSSMARRSSSSVASLITVLIVKTLAFVAPALVVVILEPDLAHPLRGDAQQEGDVAHRDTGGTTQRNVTAGSGADLGLQRLSAGAGRARRESDDVVRLAERRETAQARARIN